MVELIRVRPRSLAGVLLAFAATIGLPATSSAICMAPDPDPMTYAESGIAIFVGTVAETQVLDQNALIHVQSVWWGGPLAEWQDVRGVSTDNEVWSTTTTFEVGSRYLVVADHRRRHMVLVDLPDAILWDRSCVTQRYSARLAAWAPDDAARPTPARRPASWGNSAPSGPWPALFIGAAAVAVTAAAWRLRPRQPPEISNDSARPERRALDH